MSTLNNFANIAPTFIANVPYKKNSPKFLFVTINKPDEIKNSTRQFTIRRHAKKDADRARKAKRQNHLVLEVSRLDQSTISESNPSNLIQAEQPLGSDKQRSQQADGTYSLVAEHNNQEYSSLSFLTSFGLGRGFAAYPIEPNSREIQLLGYLWQGGATHPLMEIWLTIGMTHSSSFNIILATAALTLAREVKKVQEETNESIMYYTKSLYVIGKQLSNPRDKTSDGVVATILGFACLDHSVGNWNRWKLHMDGLERIIQLRGGIQSLQESLQLTAFWIDISGSLILDTIPRFPAPHYKTLHPQPQPSPQIIAFSQKWHVKFPNLCDISKGLTSLASLASYINQHGLTKSKPPNNDRELQNRSTTSPSDQSSPKPIIPRGDLLILLNAYLVTHNLLSTSRYPIKTPATSVNNYPELNIHETLRLTSLLFINLLKHYCRLSPFRNLSENIRNVKVSGFAVGSLDWSGFLELKLWVLVVLVVVGDVVGEEGGFVESEMDATSLVSRSWYANEIITTMISLHLSSWIDALKVLKEAIWIGEMLDDSVETIGREVECFLEKDTLRYQSRDSENATLL